MYYYHTETGELPTIERVDYNGHKFDDVLGDDRFRQKRKAITDYRDKLRSHIAECKEALRNAGEAMEMGIDRIR